VEQHTAQGADLAAYRDRWLAGHKTTSFHGVQFSRKRDILCKQDFARRCKNKGGRQAVIAHKLAGPISVMFYTAVIQIFGKEAKTDFGKRVSRIQI